MTSMQRRTLLATIIGSGVVFLDGSVVNLALPTMASELNAAFNGQQWIVDGYLLTLSALILLGGSLGDILGRKRIYFWGVVGFAVASIMCVLAPNLEWLVAARLLQGISGALMVPGALAIIDTNFSERDRGRAIGSWTASTSAMIAVGPLIGGYLIDIGSWRWIFLINVPLLILVLLLGARSIKESTPRVGRRVDFVGAGLAMTGLGGIVYGLIEGPAQAWNIGSVATLVGGVILLTAFVLYESKQKDPMLPLHLFHSPNFVGANITTFAMYGALGGFFFMFLIYLQTQLHYSSLIAGLTLLPVTLCLTLLSGKAGELAGRYGPRLFITIGPIIAGVGLLTLLPLGAGASYVTEMLPGLVLFGVGMATTVAPLTNTVLASVKLDDAGIASGVNNAISRVSGLVVIALLGIWGAAHAYQVAVLMCGGLAVGAGVMSYLLIRNPPQRAVKD